MFTGEENNFGLFAMCNISLQQNTTATQSATTDFNNWFNAKGSHLSQKSLFTSPAHGSGGPNESYALSLKCSLMRKENLRLMSVWIISFYKNSWYSATTDLNSWLKYGRGVIVYQNTKIPHRPMYYEYMGKMGHQTP